MAKQQRAQATTSKDRENRSKFFDHVRRGLSSDSPRAVLSAAGMLGGPDAWPHLMAEAAAEGAWRTVLMLLEENWPADLDDQRGLSALCHAARAENPDIRDRLLAAGADPLVPRRCFLSPLGLSAMVGDIPAIDALLRVPSPRLSTQAGLDIALRIASTTDSPQAGSGCLALEERGADWRFVPSISSSHVKPGLGGHVANTAQLAAFRGPLTRLMDSAAFRLALSDKHPPRKGRGPWTDWRSLDIPADRAVLVEAAVIASAIDSSTPLAEPAIRRPLRV